MSLPDNAAPLIIVTALIIIYLVSSLVSAKLAVLSQRHENQEVIDAWWRLFHKRIEEACSRMSSQLVVESNSEHCLEIGYLSSARNEYGNNLWLVAKFRLTERRIIWYTSANLDKRHHTDLAIAYAAVDFMEKEIREALLQLQDQARLLVAANQ